ncbi:hypothetical protein, partial [Nguyenibacter vanlangensis]
GLRSRDRNEQNRRRRKGGERHDRAGLDMLHMGAAAGAERKRDQKGRDSHTGRSAGPARG